jgi:hypothetical protein
MSSASVYCQGQGVIWGGKCYSLISPYAENEYFSLSSQAIFTRPCGPVLTFPVDLITSYPEL